MAVLVYADHDGSIVRYATNKAVTAALAISSEVHILVAGVDAPAASAAAIMGVSKVLVATSDALSQDIAEAVEALVTPLMANYDAILFVAGAVGKNAAPRIAAKLDVAIISDIVEVSGAKSFVRPIYAGNALESVESTDDKLVVTVRSTAFKASENGNNAIPSNISRFFEILQQDGTISFVPVEDIIIHNIHHLFRNVEVLSVSLFRINRNGDFTLEESEDIESNFLEELKRKLQTRRTGRVVRMDVMDGADPWMVRLLKIQWDLDVLNIFTVPRECMLDFTGLNQVIGHKEFKARRATLPPPIKPVSFPEQGTADLFEVLKERDILLHHPYNSMEPVLELLEKAAEDPLVLSIKITIYRLAKESRVSSALPKAAENGKHVSVLFEVKARFDEENNLREAQRLQRAGCFVIYAFGTLKTHTKLLLIVRREPDDRRPTFHAAPHGAAWVRQVEAHISLHRRMRWRVFNSRPTPPMIQLRLTHRRQPPMRPSATVALRRGWSASRTRCGSAWQQRQSSVGAGS